MKLEDEVVSLPLAKRLKELKVKQDSYWHWIDHFLDSDDNLCLYRDGFFLIEHYDLEQRKDRCLVSQVEAMQFYSAFTVAELGEMLPWFVIGKLVRFKDGRWAWLVVQIGETAVTLHQFFDTEADARAKMLIYLIENGLVKPEGA